jgi:hypothetical protein
MRGTGKSVGPDSVSDYILKLDRKAITPCFAQLLDTAIDTATAPSELKKDTV